MVLLVSPHTKIKDTPIVDLQRKTVVQSKEVHQVEPLEVQVVEVVAEDLLAAENNRGV